MGTVLLARAVGGPVGIGGFERLVTIKRMHAHLVADGEASQRFLEEAAVAARIHHANVVGVHQVGTDATGHFLVQDYVEGDTLDGLVDRASVRRTRVAPSIALRIALDALAGLHAAHEARDTDGRPLHVLHRDVSTHNLLVGRDGITRLLDFGIAKHAASNVVTDERYMHGRVLFMAPEYLRREKLDRRFDVYGLGVALWIALAGREPWPDASEAQIFAAVLGEGVPPLASTGLAIAPAIEAIVAKACARDRDARYASARAMLEAIEDVGRRTGWIASHAEVAALVEELAGGDLDARRDAIAKARAPHVTTEREAERAPSSAHASIPPRRRAGVAVIASSAAVLAVGAIAAFVALTRTSPPRAEAASPSSDRAPPVASIVATGAPSAESVEPTSTGTRVVDASAPQTSSRSTSARRALASSSAVSTSAAAPTVLTPPSTAAPVATATMRAPEIDRATTAPSTISTSNPYR